MKYTLGQMSSYLKKQEAILRAGVTGGIKDVSELAVLSTPIDTGNLRANWNPSIGAPDNSVTDFMGDAGKGIYAPEPSSSSDLAIRRMRGFLKAAFGNIFHMTNSADYASDVLSGGKSAQAPYGIDSIITPLIQRIFKNAMDRAKYSASSREASRD